MKPLQIGLLVLVGALGGAVIMRFTQRPKPVTAPVATAAPALPAVSMEPVPDEPAAPPAPVAAEKPAPVPESAPQPARPARREKPVRAARPAITTVARNVPPAPAAAPIAPPAPEPMQKPASAPEPAAAAPSETPAPAPVAPPEPVEEPAAAEAPSVTLPSGLVLPVRLGESLSSDRNQTGDTFTATLDAPVSAGGFVIAERGARVEGRIVEAQKSSRVKSQATLVLELTRLSTSDGQHVPIQTDAFRKKAAGNVTGDEVGMVAAAAGVGAIIGAMAGGGKGAAIGAGAGGAVGAGGVAATRAKAVALPAETKLSFHLQQPVTITERLSR